MKKDLTEMVFILDRSGSMGGMESDTIGGYNSMISKTKKGKGNAVVTTVLFDDQMEVLTDRTSLKEIKKMTENEYYVRGCTALLDAIGETIKHIRKVHKKMDEKEVPEKTIFVITTDGLENASRKHSYEDIKKLITKQKEKHDWEFLFLGADFDAVQEASKIGIEMNRSVRFKKDKVGMAMMYCDVADAINLYRSDNQIDDEWSDRIRKDYEDRKDDDSDEFDYVPLF